MIKKREIKERTATLLLHCPDTQGILATVTTFITDNGGNITYLAQNVDRDRSIFFMRVEWDLTNFLIPDDRILETFDLLYGKRYGMKCELYFGNQLPRMALFVSRMSHCLFDILGRYTAGEWRVEIPLIVSNHEDLRSVADSFGIPFYRFEVNRENKLEQEAAMLELLSSFDIDFVVLARYMQVLSPNFVGLYPNRIINIHHSFLPAFVGAKPYHAAFERGVKLIGATSHYVTDDLDAGPIIEQDVSRVSHRDTISDMIHKGRDIEKIVLSRALEKHIDHKVLVYGNKTVVFT
ncbi:MAG: formyltetrahydrofolate deformylase [Rikenellaceae bacterium]